MVSAIPHRSYSHLLLLLLLLLRFAVDARLRRDSEAAADELTICPRERGALLLDGDWCDVGVADDRAGRT
jgi:hypothetical protein